MHNTASHEAGAKNKVFGPSFLPLFTGVRGRQILGSSHTRGSKKFTLGGRPTPVSPIRQAEEWLWGLHADARPSTHPPQGERSSWSAEQTGLYPPSCLSWPQPDLSQLRRQVQELHASLRSRRLRVRHLG